MSQSSLKTRKPLAIVATAVLALFMSVGFALPANAGDGDEVYLAVVDPIPPTAPTCESDGPIVPDQPDGVIVSEENGGLTIVFSPDTGFKFFDETQTVYPFSAPEGCDTPGEGGGGGPVQHTEVDICHWNEGDGGRWIRQPDVDDDSIVKENGHGTHHDAQDIIPPFEYYGGSFPGLNWDPEHIAIYNNDCEELPEEHPDIVTHQDGEPYWDCPVPGEDATEISYLRTYFTSSWDEETEAYGEPEESGSEVITDPTPEGFDAPCPPGDPEDPEGPATLAETGANPAGPLAAAALLGLIGAAMVRAKGLIGIN
jgi:hypothetical protein